MRIYNTLTRRKEEFRPIKEGEAGIYTCGPTVYNYAHIGNMRTFITEDLQVRAMRFLGWKVKRVMNITDVGHLVSDADTGEDKMEQGARREGKSAWDVAKFYTEAFFADFKALNCVQPDVVCAATDYVKEMIDLGLTLEKKGYTYRIDGDGIYFDTSKFPDYGKLAGKKHIEGIQEGARIEANEGKRNPTDFAVWKFSAPEEKRQMEWDSPWGKGFPGWHMECSAMAMKHLGETMDMHWGGEDHVAIHHTNEIAQSEAATGKPFANYWLHARFLVTGDAGKMSKSSGEFLTTSLLPKKGYDPLAYRYYCLQTHYRKQLEFTWEGLDAATKGLERLREAARRLVPEKGDTMPHGVPSSPAAKYLADLKAALEDDLNIPQALACAWEAARDEAVPAAERLAFLKEADKVLGLELFAAPKAEADLEPELLALVEARAAARKAKDFKRSDELRAELAAKGVLVEDTSAGQKWRRRPS